MRRWGLKTRRGLCSELAEHMPLQVLQPQQQSHLKVPVHDCLAAILLAAVHSHPGQCWRPQGIVSNPFGSPKQTSARGEPCL